LIQGRLGDEGLEVIDTPCGNKVTRIAVVFDVAEDAFLTTYSRVIEVVGCVAESVYLHLFQGVARVVGKKPVEDDAAFEAALGMKYEDDLVSVFCGTQSSGNERVAGPGVGSAKVKTPFQKALDDVEDNAGPAKGLRYYRSRAQDENGTHVGL